MSLTAVRYTAERSAEWDGFIEQSINGTFLHKRAFYNTNTANAGDDYSFLFYKKNTLIAVIPAMVYTESGQKFFHSHKRSTYGGIIINESVGIAEAVELVSMLIAEMKNAEINRIVIRNPFRILYKRISDEADYALWYHGFNILSREAEVYIDLSAEKMLIKKRYDNGTKYNIKKAWKFVSVAESGDLQSFWSLLEKNLAEKHEKKPVHSLEEIKLLIKNCGAGNIRLFAAFHDGKMAAGCLVFLINKAVHAQYIAQEGMLQEFRPVNAVLDFIIDWAKEQQFLYFNLGTANDGGKIINEGLFHFKESFGGRSVLRETMYLDL